MKKQKQKHNAVIFHASIKGIVNGQNVPMPLKVAQKKIADLRQKYVARRGEENELDEIVLWIKGYDVSKSELKRGYLGHFASISISPTSETNKVLLTIKKIDVELAKHPQKKYVHKHIHPNWGHPVLRKVKSGKEFESFESAVAALDALQKNYPSAIRVNRRLLRIMIFGQEKESAKKTVRKHVLRISESDGKVRIYDSTVEPTNRDFRPNELLLSRESIFEIVMGLPKNEPNERPF